MTGTPQLGGLPDTTGPATDYAERSLYSALAAATAPVVALLLVARPWLGLAALAVGVVVASGLAATRR